MKKSLILPSKRSVYKDLSNKTLKDRLKLLVAHPIGQYALLGVILCLVNFLAQFGILPKSLTTAISSVIVYAIISIGFCLLLGYSGLASLGTAGFAGIGAYCAYYAFQVMGMSFFTALILSVVVAAGIGLFVGFISLRIEGMYLAILTLGLAEILFKVFKNLNQMPKINISNITFLFIKLDNNMKFILITAMFVFLLWLTNNLINSPTGRAMLAMKNSTSAAQAMGISLIKYRLLAFVISTIYASIGGMLYIMVTRAIATSSSTFLSLTMSLNILGAVIVGGSRSLWGTSIGVLLIFGIQSIFLINVPFFVEHPEFMGIVTGVLLIVIVMFYPGGLAQLFLELKVKYYKFIQKRRIKKYGTH
ncbi:MAG: branched-chain amino acid ABC transporter permease [Bacilli bacterium]|nr:branched-chain amino acid ABC transporter permease [Bacilli bacterium]